MNYNRAVNKARAAAFIIHVVLLSIIGLGAGLLIQACNLIDYFYNYLP
jgi:hypothetical protein